MPSHLPALTSPPLLLHPQALADAEAAHKQGDDKAWRKNFVRAMNHMTMRRVAEAQGAARGARSAAGGDDGASVAGQSEAGCSVVSK